MWLFTEIGFFSVVLDPRKPGNVQVRARAETHIRALAAFIRKNTPKPTATNRRPVIRWAETPNADYRFRLSISKKWWVRVAAELARQITATNFKNTIHDGIGKNDPELNDALLRVWSAMHQYQIKKHGPRPEVANIEQLTLNWMDETRHDVRRAGGLGNRPPILRKGK